MKTLFEKVEGINFKKVFIGFFAALLLFAAVSTIYVAGTGQWENAVAIEQNRIEVRNNAESRRAGRSNQELIATDFTQSELIAPSRDLGSRVIGGFARVYARTTSTDFDIFRIFGLLFSITFVALLALWVYVFARKHKKKPKTVTT